MNRIVLCGNLTRDPEVRYSQSNVAIVSASIAVNERRKKGDQWEDEAHFFDLVILGKRGEAFEKHHRKGDRALVEGRLQQDRWQDKETGKNRSRVKVLVESWEFVKSGELGGGGGQKRGWSGDSGSASKPAADDPFAHAGGASAGGDFLEVDDTPF